MRLDNIYKSLNVIKFYCSQTNMKTKEEFVTRVLEARWSSLGLFSFRWSLFGFPETKRDQNQKGFLKSTSVHQKSFSEFHRKREDSERKLICFFRW